VRRFELGRFATRTDIPVFQALQVQNAGVCREFPGETAVKSSQTEREAWRLSINLLLTFNSEATKSYSESSVFHQFYKKDNLTQLKVSVRTSQRTRSDTIMKVNQ
jgi:hypothetical protein